jgi:hypothetical protein
MLPPLEKCSPTARTTITRTRSSSSSVSNTRRNWSRCGIDTILKGGRFRMLAPFSSKRGLLRAGPGTGSPALSFFKAVIYC